MQEVARLKIYARLRRDRIVQRFDAELAIDPVAAVFGQVLERAWTESHPALTDVSSEPDSVCGPDGCPV